MASSGGASFTTISEPNVSLSSLLLAPLYDRLTRPSEQACVADWRGQLLAPLSGEVLDIGAGTGANIAHYGDAVTRIIAAEPDRHMRRRLRTRAGGDERIEIAAAPIERLPVANESIDVAVSTLVLCSVDDPRRGLDEVLRVLRPGGKLIFIEHVAAANNPDRLRWQRRIEPLWKRLFAGCHLTRDTEGELVSAGFEIESIERESMRKAAPVVRPTIRGVARKQ